MYLYPNVHDILGRERPGGKMRRKQVTFAAEIKSIGNGFFIPITKKDVERMGLNPGDDVDVTVTIPEMIDDDR